MRLLKLSAGRDFEFTRDFEEDDIPPYAILSHTWGKDEEEVTYKDVLDGAGKHKRGHEKLVFCDKQAQRDGYGYFWVDTCCIDTSNSVELNTAIASMYQGYAIVRKCYVYLPDVSIVLAGSISDAGRAWHSEFRSSRWLIRGWTLQELLASKVVEFYDNPPVMYENNLWHNDVVTSFESQRLGR